MGHVSAIMPAKHYGTILCMNANFTRPEGRATRPGEPLKAAKVRIFTGNKEKASMLGEVLLQADGSFMAQVPAEVPLGFESLDAQGNTLLKSEPFLWLRPGENRSCIGCHEPYNHTIPNIRPLAAGLPPAVLVKGGS
jgi:hypothetical protein